MTRSAPSAIAGVETFVLHPDGLGTGLRISIARPSDRWGRGAPAGPLSVVFLTDADYAFGTVVEASRLGQFGAEVGPMIVVGIGYADEHGDYAFVEQRRNIDFFRGPRHSFEVPGLGSLEIGGADAFLAALLDTVAPEVERRAPETAGARRVLIGMSAGGHFAAHVLTQRPDAFQGYALLSPALFDPWPAPGDEQLVEAVRALPSGSILPDTTVFLSAGGREEEPGNPLADGAIISNVYRMRAALAAHGVRTELAVFADETHNSALGVGATRALRFLVPPATQQGD